MVRSRLVALVTLAVLLPASVLATGDPLAERQWHLERVGATESWEAGRGEGVTIAVIDTGVQADHPDLEGQLVPGRDFVERDSEPDDPSGHGTVVAGIIAAIAGNGVGGAGVAPRARIMPVRVLDEHGRGRSRAAADGIRWAVGNGADVINLSLTEEPGSPTSLVITSAVERAIHDAHAEGVVVVGAAGNSAGESVPYDEDVPVIVIGATDRDDEIWERSNRDQRTLFAPGVEIVSTFKDDGYARADGTSFAAPIVSAAVALLLEQGVEPGDVRERLESTAVDIGEGLGRVDVARAVAASRPPPTAEPDPAATAEAPPPDPEPTPQPEPEPTPEPPPPESEPEPTAEPEPTPEPLVTLTPEPATETAPPLPPGVTPLPLAEVEPEVAEADRGDLVIQPPRQPAALSEAPRQPGWPEGLALTLLVAMSVGHIVARKSLEEPDRHRRRR